VTLLNEHLGDVEAHLTRSYDYDVHRHEAEDISKRGLLRIFGIAARARGTVVRGTAVRGRFYACHGWENYTRGVSSSVAASTLLHARAGLAVGWEGSMYEQPHEPVLVDRPGDGGHLRAHMREMEDMLGRRARWAYLTWVAAWAAILLFAAVIFWSSGRVGL
jgi:hypothetical protein